MAFGTPEPPPQPVETRYHFGINFTTQFQNLHIMRDSKIPVKQPPSLGGTNLPWGPAIFFIYQIFLLPQVERCAIISYKHGIYELPHEVPNELRLGI